jgi:hypothetical protein
MCGPIRGKHHGIKLVSSLVGIMTFAYITQFGFTTNPGDRLCVLLILKSPLTSNRRQSKAWSWYI